MRNFFRKYFSYSRKELRSLYYLILILFLSISFRIYQSESNGLKLDPDDELLAKNLRFIQSLSLKESAKKTIPEKSVEVNRKFFFFDPNTVQYGDMKKLGLSANVISNIQKYRKKGGAFRKPEDLKMIYGLEDEMFSSIQAWINIEDREEKNPVYEKIEIDKIPNIDYDLNSVEYKDLLLITYRNTKITGRIIKYRNLLGGFSSIEQLKDVYDMNDSIYNSLCRNSRIDTSIISKISLNNSNYSDFLKHPYIKKESVDLIMKYREFKKSEINFIEFTESGLLPDSIMNLIKPYLKN